MFHALVRSAAVAMLGLAPAISSAHAIFPGRANVQTLGDRAIVQLHAVNARKDVSTFVVEVFDSDTWVPARNAVAWPKRLNVRAKTDPDSGDAEEAPFSVMVDLRGKSEQRLKVCTKSLPSPDQFRSRLTIVNTRVCSSVVVSRFQP